MSSKQIKEAQVLASGELKLLRALSKNAAKNFHGREGRLADELVSKGYLTNLGGGSYALTAKATATLA